MVGMRVFLFLSGVLVLVGVLTAEEALSVLVSNPGIRFRHEEVGDRATSDHASSHNRGNDRVCLSKHYEHEIVIKQDQCKIMHFMNNLHPRQTTRPP